MMNTHRKEEGLMTVTKGGCMFRPAESVILRYQKVPNGSTNCPVKELQYSVRILSVDDDMDW